MELHEDSREGLPPVKAKVTLGKEDLSIKVNPTHVLSQNELKTAMNLLFEPFCLAVCLTF